MRFIFDTTVEDVLLTRDCEVAKQGESGFLFVVILRVFKAAFPLKFLPYSDHWEPFVFV